MTLSSKGAIIVGYSSFHHHASSADRFTAVNRRFSGYLAKSPSHCCKNILNSLEGKDEDEKIAVVVIIFAMFFGGIFSCAKSPEELARQELLSKRMLLKKLTLLGFTCYFLVIPFLGNNSKKEVEVDIADLLKNIVEGMDVRGAMLEKRVVNSDALLKRIGIQE